MSNVKIYLMFLLLSVALGVAGQEICDNGIDDDADGLVDLNDDECDCGEILPLVDVTGYVCNGTLKLIATDENAISYQWYLEGVAIVGEDKALLKLDQFDDEGCYTVMVTTATGCYTTEPYCMEVPDRELIDLGIVYICPPDCYTTEEGFTLCTPGDFSWDGTDPITGCPYEKNIEVRVGNSSEFTFNDAVCAGQTYEYYTISATTSGVYQTVIPNWFGCDSTITVNLTVEDEIPLNIDASICSGDTYNYLDISESTAGQYQTLISGNGDCDTLVTVNLSVLDPVMGSIDTTICSGSTLMIYDIEATTSGAYQTTLTSDSGCDSLLTVNLVVAEPVTSNISANICMGDTYTLHDIEATTTGSYSTTISNAAGCDSTIFVFLTVDEPITTEVDMSFCEGETFIYYDIETDVPGDFESLFTAANGCDSIVVVHLEMLNNSGIELSESICEGDVYHLYDISATETGIYYHTLTNAVGCDSLITVNLTVNDTVTVSLTEEICNGEVYTIYDTDFSTTGVYEIAIADDFGCDTLVTLQLTVLDESYATIDATICEGESYTYGDLDIDMEGTFEAILTNAVGCDSIVTVNLSVNEQSEYSFTEEICEGDIFEYYDLSVDESGTYEVVIENAAGCDSTIYVDLVVNPLQVEELEITLCAGEIYNGYGLNADVTDVYEVRFSNDDGCDSVVVIDLTINFAEDLLELGDDIEIEIGETIDIVPEYIADDLTNLVWYDENGNQLGYDRELLDYKPVVDTKVFLSGTDSNGCDVLDEINIKVELIVKIYIPNVFSPNGDGSNDEFLFKYNEGIVDIEEVLIYNRWGEHMYTATSPFRSESYMGWDGTYNGSKVNPGVYVYTIIANVIDGSTRTFAGDVTVVR